MKELNILQMEEIEGGWRWLVCAGAAGIAAVGIAGAATASMGAGAILATYALAGWAIGVCDK